MLWILFFFCLFVAFFAGLWLVKWLYDWLMYECPEDSGVRLQFKVGSVEEQPKTKE